MDEKWEHKIVGGNSSQTQEGHNKDEVRLNAIGLEGWQVVTMTLAKNHYRLYLIKRRLPKGIVLYFLY